MAMCVPVCDLWICRTRPRAHGDMRSRMRAHGTCSCPNTHRVAAVGAGAGGEEGEGDTDVARAAAELVPQVVVAIGAARGAVLFGRDNARVIGSLLE